MEGPIKLPIPEYVKHINRMYESSEHLFNWLRRISISEGEPEGKWITSLISELTRLKSGLEWYGRDLSRMVRECPDKGFIFETNKYKNSLTKFSERSILVALYFPPEEYPAVDGVYPKIHIDINDLNVCKIQLDETKRLYKPLDDGFWIHKNLLNWNSIHVYTDQRPYHTIEILDSSIPDNFDEHIFMYSSKVRRLSHANNSFRIEPMEEKMYITMCSSSDVLSYPYIKAVNTIKRFWAKYKQRKNRHIIGTGVRSVADRGVDAIELASKYKDNKMFTKNPQ